MVEQSVGYEVPGVRTDMGGSTEGPVEQDDLPAAPARQYDVVRPGVLVGGRHGQPRRNLRPAVELAVERSETTPDPLEAVAEALAHERVRPGSGVLVVGGTDRPRPGVSPHPVAAPPVTHSVELLDPPSSAAALPPAEATCDSCQVVRIQLRATSTSHVFEEQDLHPRRRGHPCEQPGSPDAVRGDDAVLRSGRRGPSPGGGLIGVGLVRTDLIRTSLIRRNLLRTGLVRTVLTGTGPGGAG